MSGRYRLSKIRAEHHAHPTPSHGIRPISLSPLTQLTIICVPSLLAFLLPPSTKNRGASLCTRASGVVASAAWLVNRAAADEVESEAVEGRMILLEDRRGAARRERAGRDAMAARVIEDKCG